jgi:Raf kinase inhibitor-like YbhB/YbcL family protein
MTADRIDRRPCLRFCLITTLSLAAVATTSGGDSSGKLQLMTTAFRAGGRIPDKFTCSGENVSPALSWSQPPARAQSFALIMDDPDAPAGTWVHWVVYDLPAAKRELQEHVLPGENVSGGGAQGVNDFSERDYGGPCPPPGKPHRYFFRLYALDTTLNLHGPARRQEVDSAMKGHVIAQAELMGTFGR